MREIRVLDSGTIDKIAAGEVVERPANVVKELVENAVDAGAGAVTVEIKDGGTSMIRVTDNGSGIEKEQVPNAFLRHATSKIRTAGDLLGVTSLGFRGEALSSIAAVSQAELVTKTADSLTGSRFTIEGGVPKELEEIGAPNGTTIIIRNLFYNTPPRRKFLKTPATESGYISELMEHLAMSRPDVSFQYIQNGQTRLHTAGNGDLKQIVHRIYGRDTASNLVPVEASLSGFKIDGYLGKPVITRSNRNFENYFINGRYVKSSLISKGIEEGYRPYLMQHKYPFTALHFTVDGGLLDVNVHPSKMEVRFVNQTAFYSFLAETVEQTLRGRELIPGVELTEKTEKRENTREIKYEKAPEPFEQNRVERLRVAQESAYRAKAQPPALEQALERKEQTGGAGENTPRQMELFEDRLLTPKARVSYRILGQLFETYWLVEYGDKLFIIDQHAAHEKVKYENMVRQLRGKSAPSQTLNPPVIVTLSGREETALRAYFDRFLRMGFELEAFGGNEIAIRAVPMDLYGCDEKRMFLEMLDELEEAAPKGEPDVVLNKLASMACKAAVKGNNRLSTAEMESLLDQLLTLENPYHCPHGRPTIISMSKYEIEKKFKRV